MVTTDPRLGHPRVPLYRALQVELQQEILSGALGPGDWLPSESQLSRTYGVSQTSVRRALLELQRLGLIERYQGRGSAVASNELRVMSPMLGLGRELRQRGFEVTPELLSNEEEVIHEHVATRVDMPTGSTVRNIKRRYWANDQPLAYLDHYLPLQRGIDYSEFDGDSLYAFLAVRDALPTHARERVTALNVSAAEADLLNVHEGCAVLLRARVSYRADGRAMEFTRYLIRNDRYHLEVDLKMQVMS